MVYNVERNAQIRRMATMVIYTQQILRMKFRRTGVSAKAKGINAYTTIGGIN
jgi:hypothetical protein